MNKRRKKKLCRDIDYLMIGDTLYPNYIELKKYLRHHHIIRKDSYRLKTWIKAECKEIKRENKIYFNNLHNKNH